MISSAIWIISLLGKSKNRSTLDQQRESHSLIHYLAFTLMLQQHSLLYEFLNWTCFFLFFVFLLSDTMIRAANLGGEVSVNFWTSPVANWYRNQRRQIGSCSVASPTQMALPEKDHWGCQHWLLLEGPRACRGVLFGRWAVKEQVCSGTVSLPLGPGRFRWKWAFGWRQILCRWGKNWIGTAFISKYAIANSTLFQYADSLRPLEHQIWWF